MFSLHLGDCLEILPTLPDASVDAIITDPPYPKEYLPLYKTLAEESARLLTDGGLLAVMCGQSYMPELLDLMRPHLIYRWTMAYVMLGGQAVQIWPRKVITFWKPVFVFSKNKHANKWFGDTIKSPANDKTHHKWGQSIGGMIELVTRLTVEGQTILDPFLGGGTTGAACIKTGRNFIGIESDAGCYSIAQRRLESEAATLPLFAEVA